MVHKKRRDRQGVIDQRQKEASSRIYNDPIFIDLLMLQGYVSFLLRLCMVSLYIYEISGQLLFSNQKQKYTTI